MYDRPRPPSLPLLGPWTEIKLNLAPPEHRSGNDRLAVRNGLSHPALSRARAPPRAEAARPSIA
eukprot:2753940-Alexandrium_andersonii.AAC.1